MAYAMTKQGSLDNCVTYEFMCDTVEDMNAIEDRYRTIGTIAIVLQGNSGLEVYIASSDKQWNSFSGAGAGGSAAGAGLSIHICGQSEIENGLPSVNEPDEATIYLVPASDGSSGNLYDEYVYVADAWEKFGSGGVSNDLPITYEATTLEFEDVINADINNPPQSEEEQAALMKSIIIEDITKLTEGPGVLQVGDNRYQITIEKHGSIIGGIVESDGGRTLEAIFQINIEQPELTTNVPAKLIVADANNTPNETYPVRIEFNGGGALYSTAPTFYLQDAQVITENTLRNYLGDYVTTNDLSDYVTTNDLSDYVTTDDLSDYTLPLPSITSNDEGKVLKVTSGEWALENEINANEKIDKNYNSNFEPMQWHGQSEPDGLYIWTDGKNMYYSYGSIQCVLDNSTSTWNNKVWNGLSSFSGDDVWTDGENIYYSHITSHYVLDKSTSTWNNKVWSGMTNFDGSFIWTDGENIYYSYDRKQYVLDKSTSTWSSKAWNRVISFSGDRVWTDGENIYYSDNGAEYVLDKSTSTWNNKVWNGMTQFAGNNIWTDGENIYYSGAGQYILDKSTSTWNQKRWNGLTGFAGAHIWTDGNDIYYSEGSNQYIWPRKQKMMLLGAQGKFNSVISVKSFIASYLPVQLPTPPTTNGTYILQAVVADGTTTYSWVNLPAAQGVSF